MSAIAPTAATPRRHRKRRLAALGLVAGLLLTGTTAAGGAQAATVGAGGVHATAGGYYNGQIPRGGTLYSDAGQYITNSNGTVLGTTFHYKMIMQSDGNLVIYKSLTGAGLYDFKNYVCWASNTQGRGGIRVTYQSDGNFVMYDAWGVVRWASHTAGRGGTTVNLNPHGALYVGTTRITPNCD